MPATPLGSDALKALLAGHGHVVLANRTDADDDVTIVAAALARHYPGGDVKQETAFALQLEADESVGLDPLLPHHEPPDAVEVLLRVRVEEALVDAYVLLQRPAGESLVRFEAGVKKNTGVLEEGEELLGESAQFVIYGTPAGGGA